MKPNRTTRRRLAVGMLLTVALVAVFAVRLVDLQVVSAAEFNEASLDKRAIDEVKLAPRGDIVDSNGSVLATSVTRYDITASPKWALPFKRSDAGGTVVEVSVFQALSDIAAITGANATAMLTAVESDPSSDFAYLVRSVDIEQFRQIRDLRIPWVYPQPLYARTYPNGAVAGNLVGFVGTDGPQNALEATADWCLASTDGTATYERGADGVRLPGSTVTEQEAIPGGTLALTIDGDLQWFVQQAIAEQARKIGAESAMATVVRVSDGHVLAMADYPAVDPNNVDGTKVQFLGARSFNYMFEPGSIMKALTAAMLVDAGKANQNTQVTVPPVWISPEKSRVVDSSYHGTLQLTLTGVLEQSSNIGISILGARMGNGDRYKYLRDFGLGEVSAVDFQGEAEGLLASYWDDQQKYDITYGQGVSVTLAQMASAFQALGNGGLRVPLTLVESCTRADGTVVTPEQPEPVQVVSPKAADTTVKMLESVVNSGFLAQELTVPGYRVAAKTGTGEVARGGVYTSDRIVSVAGLAPADNPEFVVIVTYVKPQSVRTSAAAAPTFRKIMTQVLKTYRVPPSTTKGPSWPTTW